MFHRRLRWGVQVWSSVVLEVWILRDCLGQCVVGHCFWHWRTVIDPGQVFVGSSLNGLPDIFAVKSISRRGTPHRKLIHNYNFWLTLILVSFLDIVIIAYLILTLFFSYNQNELIVLWKLIQTVHFYHHFVVRSKRGFRPIIIIRD